MVSQYIPNASFPPILQTEPHLQRTFLQEKEDKKCSGNDVVTGTHSKIKLEMY